MWPPSFRQLRDKPPTEASTKHYSGALDRAKRPREVIENGLRRTLVLSSGLVLLAPLGALSPRAAAAADRLEPRRASSVTLLSAPIELAGNWGRMIPYSADLVVELMRRACLDGVRLVSDAQPTRLRVDEHTSGSPAVWLHDDGTTTAWVIVDIGERAWCQLAYQFGHELGHVLANSWRWRDQPGGTMQWLEEALVESFSIRGLGRLGPMWKQTPPFPNDNAYGDAVLSYRQDVITQYTQLQAAQGGLSDMAAWYARHKAGIEAGDGLNQFAKAAAPVIVAEYERTPHCVEALGALNRWPGRARLPLGDYLNRWIASCAELQCSPALPLYLKSRLGVA
jgi:hypothetical protein